MKTQLTKKQKNTFKTLKFVSIVIITMLAFNTTYAQKETPSMTKTSNKENIIKGTVSDANGALESVSILLKGSLIGTTSDKKGDFIFPKALKTGDVLIFSYLGYKTQKIMIEEGKVFINLKLKEDFVEMTGALETNKPYKSKRKN